MVIGSILLQPQRLARAGQIPAGDAVLGDIVDLVVRLMIDGGQGNGRLGERVGDSLQGTVVRLTTRAGAGVDRAARRFGDLFAPLIARIQAAIQQPPGGVDAVIDGLEEGVTSVVRVLENLTPEQIRQAMRTIFDIIETDLGITPDFIQDLVLACLDDMILALGHPQPAEALDERINRRTVAAILVRIRRYLRENFTFPALNAEAAAQVFITLRQRPDVDAELKRALCSGKAAATLLRTGGTLVDLLPYSAFPSFGEGSVGAAAAAPPRDEVSFYASKLLEHDNYRSNLGEIPIVPDTLKDGTLQPSLREAFLHASVVLARSAFLNTVEKDKKWLVVDRKRYVVSRVDNRLWVYRLFVISLSDFLDAANQGEDQSELRTIFRENGIPLPAAEIEVSHSVGKNTWDIVSDGMSFVGTSFGARLRKKIAIRPATLTESLFDLPATLQPATNEKVPASGLRQAFEDNGIPLSSRCSLTLREPGREWLLDDGEFQYTIKKKDKEEETEKDRFEISTGSFRGWARFISNLFLGVPKGNMVWVNRERTQVLLGQRIMHTGSNVSWHDAPIFKNGNRYYSLKNRAAVLDGWAYHASWLRDLVDVIFYAIQIGRAIDKGEVQYSISSNGLEAGRLISELVAKWARRRPMTQIVGVNAWWYDFFLWFGIRFVIKIIEGLLKPDTSGPTSASQGSQLVDKGISAVLGVKIVHPHWSALLYEFILSLLTLVNHEEPAEARQQRPRNYKESGGFVDLFTKGGLLVYTGLIPDSEYALPFQTLSLTGGYWLGALGIGAAAGFIGLLVGQQAIAGVSLSADAEQSTRRVAISSGKSLAYFWPYLKLVKGKVDWA